MNEDRFEAALRQCRKVRDSDFCRVRWNEKKKQARITASQKESSEIGDIATTSASFPVFLDELLQRLNFTASEKQAFLREFWKVQGDINQRISLEDLQDMSMLCTHDSNA